MATGNWFSDAFANPKFKQFASEGMQDLGFGLATAPNIGDAFGYASQYAQRQQPARDLANRQRLEDEKSATETNMTKEWLKSKGRDDLIPLVDAGQGMFALQEATKVAQGQDPTSAMQNYQYLISQGIDGQTAMERAFGGGGAGDALWQYELFH